MTPAARQELLDRVQQSMKAAMWRHEAARVYDVIIFHVRAPACPSRARKSGRLDAAGWGSSEYLCAFQNLRDCELLQACFRRDRLALET